MSAAVSVLLDAVPLTVAGVAVPILFGGYRWLRAVSGAVSKLTEVSHQLGQVSEAQAEAARQIRHTRRELALHLRECAPSARRALPVPRSILEEAVDL